MDVALFATDILGGHSGAGGEREGESRGGVEGKEAAKAEGKDTGTWG